MKLSIFFSCKYYRILMCFNDSIKSDFTVRVIKNMLKVPSPGNDISACEGLLQLRSRGNNQRKTISWELSVTSPKTALRVFEEQARTGQETPVHPTLQQFGRRPGTGRNFRVAPLSTPHRTEANFSWNWVCVFNGGHYIYFKIRFHP